MTNRIVGWKCADLKAATGFNVNMDDSANSKLMFTFFSNFEGDRPKGTRCINIKKNWEKGTGFDRVSKWFQAAKSKTMPDGLVDILEKDGWEISDFQRNSDHEIKIEFKNEKAQEILKIDLCFNTDKEGFNWLEVMKSNKKTIESIVSGIAIGMTFAK